MDIAPTDRQGFVGIENEQRSDSEFEPKLMSRKPNELTDDELEYVIQYLAGVEESAVFNKARRLFKRTRIDLEEELEHRKALHNKV